MPRTFKILISAAKNWSADNAFKHSAAVSFYTLFSLAPITIIAITVASFFFGKEAATKQFSAQMNQLVGQASAEVIQKAMESNELHGGTWVATTIGIVLLLVGATTVFGQLQDSLNEIWSVTAKPSRSGWIVMLVQRLISFAMVVTIGFLLVSSLILSTALTSVVKMASGWMGGSEWLVRAADMGVGLIVITVLFALLFKVLPDVKLHWREVWIGAFITSLLFSVGRLLIALYLSHSTVASAYGAAGSLVALLIWIYYSSAILFYGAEYIRAYRDDHGLALEPKETAVRVRREIMEEHPTGAQTA
jgi:membrane protein